MEYVTAAVFFLFGLGIYLLVSSLAKRGRGGKGLEGLPIRGGAVRVDRMVAGSRGVREEPTSSGGAGSGGETYPETGNHVPRKRAKGGRRKR